MFKNKNIKKYEIELKIKEITYAVEDENKQKEILNELMAFEKAMKESILKRGIDFISDIFVKKDYHSQVYNIVDDILEDDINLRFEHCLNVLIYRLKNIANGEKNDTEKWNTIMKGL